MRVFWLFPSLCLWSCGLSAPARGVVVAPGVARATFEQRVRHTDLIDVRVLFPSDGEGVPLPGPFPAVVMVQGGLVSTARYDWLAQALASAGYVVASPNHANALAIFEIDNGHFVRQLLAQPPEGSVLEGTVDPTRIAVMGHSLGGVVASKLAGRGEFQALALLASFPDGSDGAGLAQGIPSLSLAGRNDCSAKLENVIAGAATLPSPTALSVLDGVTHYQFTQDDQKDIDSGCSQGVALSVAHERISASLIAFMGAALQGAGIDVSALRAVPGAEVTAR